MTWTRETIKTAQPRDPVDEWVSRFPELLRIIPTGEMLKENAWQEWKNKNCTSWGQE